MYEEIWGGGHILLVYSWIKVLFILMILAFEGLYTNMLIRDRIWEKPASTHTTARHTFHQQTIAVHTD